VILLCILIPRAMLAKKMTSICGHHNTSLWVRSRVNQIRAQVECVPWLKLHHRSMLIHGQFIYRCLSALTLVLWMHALQYHVVLFLGNGRLRCGLILYLVPRGLINKIALGNQVRWNYRLHDISKPSRMKLRHTKFAYGLHTLLKVCVNVHQLKQYQQKWWSNRNLRRRP